MECVPDREGLSNADALWNEVKKLKMFFSSCIQMIFDT